MKDDHLVPEIVKNLVANYNNSTDNQKFFAEARLRAIIKYCQKVLPKENK